MFITQDSDLLADFLTARDTFELAAAGTEDEARAQQEMIRLSQLLADSERAARTAAINAGLDLVTAHAAQPFDEALDKRSERHRELMDKAVTEAGEKRERAHFAATRKRLTEQREKAVARATEKYLSLFPAEGDR